MNPFRSPQFENSSKLLSRLETYHLHQTQLSNKPPGRRMLCSPKTRLANVKRVELISGTGDRRQKLRRKKRGGRKLILSEKADKAKKKQKMTRKHSDNWTQKAARGGQDLLLRGAKERAARLGKGLSGSPGGAKEGAYRSNYSIGHPKLQLSRLAKKGRWSREHTFQSQFDLSSEFVHSKENYNLYVNSKPGKAPLALSKMRQIVKMTGSERGLLENMRISRRGRRAEEPEKGSARQMVFIKRKPKKGAKLAKKSANARNGSSAQAKRAKKGAGSVGVQEKNARKAPGPRGKNRGSKSPGRRARKAEGFGGGKTKPKAKRKLNSSRQAKKEYLMDVFKSMTQKKAPAEGFLAEQAPAVTAEKKKFAKWDPREAKEPEAAPKRKGLEGFLKKTGQVEKFLQAVDQAKRPPEPGPRDSPEQKSLQVSSQKNSTPEKPRLEDLADKAKEARRLVKIFQEQKTGVFENKLQIENQVNAVFLKLLGLIEQERVSALRVVEDRFGAQKQAIFEVEKQLVLKEQTLSHLLSEKNGRRADCEARSEFLEHFHQMQRLIEGSKFDFLRLAPVAGAIAELEAALGWRRWLAFESESRFFVEKQTLDLNTTTQTTSRNNESLSLKKKDSELLGFHSRAAEAGPLPGRKLARNVSDVNCAAAARKRKFMKSLLEKQFERTQNKSEVVRPSAQAKPDSPATDARRALDFAGATFAKKKRNFRESEIPTHTVSSELESEEDSPAEPRPPRAEPWNGMVNSISDLREADLRPNGSSQFEEGSPRPAGEGSSAECRTDKKQLFGRKEETPESRLQTPEFGEFSYGNGFYAKPRKPNSSKILYKLYEAPEQGFELRELLRENFVTGATPRETPREGSEISASEDAQEASGFARRPPDSRKTVN